VTARSSIVLFGSRSTASVIGFKVLRELGFSLPLVITGNEDPGIDDWRLSLGAAARAAGFEQDENLMVIRDPHRPETLERIRSANADLILSLQWRRILRPSLCACARLGALNIHNAPLPLLRGCDPFSWAIHDGLQQMGVTLHQVDEGVDSGAIMAQRLWKIAPTATAWSLYQESLTETDAILRDSLPDVVAGKLKPVPQDHRYASYHPLDQFHFGELEVDWTLPATTLSAFVRSRIFPPFQLPFFRAGNTKVEILGCDVVGGRGKPGVVVDLAPLRITAKTGAIEIISARLKKQELAGADIARALKLETGQLLDN
jgi:methionyl-tRNA formyltransferase